MEKKKKGKKEKLFKEIWFLVKLKRNRSQKEKYHSKELYIYRKIRELPTQQKMYHLKNPGSLSSYQRSNNKFCSMTLLFIILWMMSNLRITKATPISLIANNEHQITNSESVDKYESDLEELESLNNNKNNKIQYPISNNNNNNKVKTVNNVNNDINNKNEVVEVVENDDEAKSNSDHEVHLKKFLANIFDQLHMEEIESNMSDDDQSSEEDEKSEKRALRRFVTKPPHLRRRLTEDEKKLIKEVVSAHLISKLKDIYAISTRSR